MAGMPPRSSSTPAPSERDDPVSRLPSRTSSSIPTGWGRDRHGFSLRTTKGVDHGEHAGSNRIRRSVQGGGIASQTPQAAEGIPHQSRGRSRGGEGRQGKGAGPPVGQPEKEGSDDRGFLGRPGRPHLFESAPRYGDGGGSGGGLRRAHRRGHR